MAFTVEHVKRLLQRDLVTELEKVKIAKGSSIKDVRINLGIFGTPPYACPDLSAFGWPPPHPARVDTRLALFETLQLVNNSHWRVKKTDHSDTGCTHVCSYYTTSIIAFQKMGLQVFQNHYLEKEKILFTWVNFTNMVDIIFFQADVHIWVTNPSPCSHLSTFAWSPSPQCADILYGWPPR